MKWWRERRRVGGNAFKSCLKPFCRIHEFKKVKKILNEKTKTKKIVEQVTSQRTREKGTML